MRAVLVGCIDGVGNEADRVGRRPVAHPDPRLPALQRLELVRLGHRPVPEHEQVLDARVVGQLEPALLHDGDDAVHDLHVPSPAC